MALFDDLLGAGLGFLGTRLASNQEQGAVNRALQLANPVSVAGPTGLASFSDGLLTLGLTPQLQQAFNQAGASGLSALNTLGGANFATREANELARLQALRQPQIDAARASLQSQLANRGRLGVGAGGGITPGLFNPESAALEEAIARTQLSDIAAARDFSQQEQSFLANQARDLIGIGNQIQQPLQQNALLGIQSRLPSALAGLAAQPGFNEANTTRGFFSGLGNTLGGIGGAIGDFLGLGGDSLGGLFGGGADALGTGGSAVGNAAPGGSANIGTPPGGGGLFGGSVGGGVGNTVPGGFANIGQLLAGPGFFSGFTPTAGTLGAAGSAIGNTVPGAIANFGGTTGVAAGGGATGAAGAAGGGLLSGGLGAALGAAAPLGFFAAGLLSGDTNAAATQAFETQLLPMFQQAPTVPIPLGAGPGVGQLGKPMTAWSPSEGRFKTIYVNPDLSQNIPGEGFREVGGNQVIRPNIDTGQLEIINFGGTVAAAGERQNLINAGVDVRGMTSDQVAAALANLPQRPTRLTSTDPFDHSP